MTSKSVINKINSFRPGMIFCADDFIGLEKRSRVLVQLSQLAKLGKIKRLTKGNYYVPRPTRFGEVGPSEAQILELVVAENGGYIGGLAALNRIGATTQVPSIVTIRGARTNRELKIGHFRIRLTRSGNTKANIRDADLTDILETLRLITRTPDGSPSKNLARVLDRVKSISASQLKRLIELALAERAYVRAMLGASIELAKRSGATKLRNSLNPSTKYRLPIPIAALPTKDRWGISTFSDVGR